MVMISNKSSNIVQTGTSSNASISPTLQNPSISSSLQSGGKELNLGNALPGQVFSGTVVDIQNNTVTIEVGDSLIHAKFDQAVDICMGEVLKFVIRENQNNQVVIAPYNKTSLSGENVALYKALEAAGLPATDHNIDVISELLKNQMPVDKKSVQAILAKSYQIPEASIEDLVMMTKYQIEITSDNLEQLQHYKENKHQITKDIIQLADSIPNMVKELLQNGKTEEALQILKSLGDNSKGESYIHDKALQQMHVLLKELAGEHPKNHIDHILKQQVLDKFSFEPKEFTKEAIEETYKNLEQQIGKLQQIVGMESNDTVTQVKNNIEFMKNINENFIYAQLPLKMKNQMSNGELYVYTNRKSTINRKEGIRLLLHLEMESLGDMNIMVHLQQSNLNLTFTMSNEEAEQIIESNIPQLTSILEKKGFIVQHRVECKEEKNPIDFVEDFIKQQEKKQEIKRFSFDMRA